MEQNVLKTKFFFSSLSCSWITQCYSEQCCRVGFWFWSRDLKTFLLMCSSIGLLSSSAADSDVPGSVKVTAEQVELRQLWLEQLDLFLVPGAERGWAIEVGINLRQWSRLGLLFLLVPVLIACLLINLLLCSKGRCLIFIIPSHLAAALGLHSCQLHPENAFCQHRHSHLRFQSELLFWRPELLGPFFLSMNM